MGYVDKAFAKVCALRVCALHRHSRAWHGASGLHVCSCESVAHETKQHTHTHTHQTAQAGTPLKVVVRGRVNDAVVTKMPFVPNTYYKQ